MKDLRIPTLLGLVVLLAGVVGGVYLSTNRQILTSRADLSTKPKQIKIANISDTSASIYWLSDGQTTGFIKAGLIPTQLDQTFNDERDPELPQKYYLHFVTLNNLQPGLTYYFKIVSGSIEESEIQSLKTLVASQLTNQLPVQGVVLNQNLQPIPEAIVVLELEGTQQLATITKASGNFILPILSTTPLAEPPQKLTIFNHQLTSQIEISLPVNQPLPAIILGQNRQIIPSPTPTPNPNLKYDFNKDTKLDEADRQLIRDNFYSQTTGSDTFDLNGDGVINQQDLSIFNNTVTKQLTPPPNQTNPPSR